ncbi:MAG: hypothetical protein FJ109_18910 [Deltaproteobacteria bacterium]|nr:hypothetical protein [Deltaproteobacteria bacterium]
MKGRPIGFRRQREISTREILTDELLDLRAEEFQQRRGPTEIDDFESYVEYYLEYIGETAD